VLSTDRVTHDLLDDEQVRADLVERWGENVAPEGSVDRDRVGEIVFADPAELAFLEGVLHPRVGTHVVEWRQGLGPEVEIAVVEVPLLFESAMEDAFDATVAVVADDEIRERRLRERGQAGLSGREERQLDQAEKERRADHVIRNEAGLEELESEVRELIDRLSSGARG
jgi:dephospho-CoA kinase